MYRDKERKNSERCWELEANDIEVEKKKKSLRNIEGEKNNREKFKLVST